MYDEFYQWICQLFWKIMHSNTSNFVQSNIRTFTGQYKSVIITAVVEAPVDKTVVLVVEHYNCFVTHFVMMI
jgi:hypothetical protein